LVRVWLRKYAMGASKKGNKPLPCPEITLENMKSAL